MANLEACIKYKTFFLSEFFFYLIFIYPVMPIKTRYLFTKWDISLITKKANRKRYNVLPERYSHIFKVPQRNKDMKLKLRL